MNTYYRKKVNRQNNVLMTMTHLLSTVIEKGTRSMILIHLISPESLNLRCKQRYITKDAQNAELIEIARDG